jgi:hypothetical protein
MQSFEGKFNLTLPPVYYVNGSVGKEPTWQESRIMRE